MPSSPARNAPHFLVLAGGLLLLGVGTASISSLEPAPVALAAATVSGAIAPLRQLAEPGAISQAEVTSADPVGDAMLTEPSPAVERRDDPPPPRPGATDPTANWVAPDGSTGPGVSAIFLVFRNSPDALIWALRVAHCESHYDPGAVNGASGATGLFQFMPSTWDGYFAGANIWDPISQAKAAFDFYNRGWTSQWECR